MRQSDRAMTRPARPLRPREGAGRYLDAGGAGRDSAFGTPDSELGTLMIDPRTRLW
jgi:hypothetical protein